MQSVSIYNVLRSAAQVQVAQALSTVAATLLSMPQIKPSPNGHTLIPQQAAPQKPAAPHVVAQTQDRVAQTTLHTVKTMSTTVRPATSVTTPQTPVLPSPTGQAKIDRPQQPAEPARTNNPTRPSPAPLGQGGSDVPVPVRAITLASLPRPETVARALMPNANGGKPSEPMAMKPVVDHATIAAKPADPVLTQLVSQLRQGVLTQTEFVKRVVAQILSGTLKQEISKQTAPLPQAIAKTLNPDPKPAPVAARPPSNSGVPVQNPAPMMSSAPSQSEPLARALAQNGASLSQIPTVLSRFDPSASLLQMSPQAPTLATIAFPQSLVELAVAQPATLQAIQTAAIPQPLKDMSSLVALYAAMIPGWPTAVERDTKRSASIPVPLMQLAQSIKSLSPEQQATLFSRMGLPLDVIRVLQQMLRDLDKKLNAKTLETFLAGLLGTMVFVVDEVISFFDELKENDPA